MALDEAIHRAVSTGDSPPTFRLFEWSHGAITFGYAQRRDDILDFERCIKDGVDVARRPTGGRAVFHNNEIAYSVTALTDESHFGGNIQKTYRAISGILCEGIALLGVNVILSSSTDDAGKTPIRSHMSPCFVTTTRHEITVGGKKLVGSAQRRFKNSFLQQGSILTGPGFERITEYMKDNDLVEHYKQLLLEKSIDLSTVLKKTIDVQILKAFLEDSFRKAVGNELDVGVPTDAELNMAQCIVMDHKGPKGVVMNHEQ